MKCELIVRMYLSVSILHLLNYWVYFDKNFELVSNRNCHQVKSIIFCIGCVQSLIYMWSLILRLSFNVELQAKGLTLGSSARRKKDLLKLNRDQLRWVVGLFTGHCHLKGHLFKLGLTDDPTCERCLEKGESATHTLRDCEAIAWARFLLNQVTIMTPP
jgi:hypothetical protein